MRKETKAAPAHGADALMRAFEEFKSANDARLAALERKRGDVLLEEKVDRIDRALTEQKSLLERAALAGRRPGARRRSGGQRAQIGLERLSAPRRHRCAHTV